MSKNDPAGVAHRKGTGKGETGAEKALSGPVGSLIRAPGTVSRMAQAFRNGGNDRLGLGQRGGGMVKIDRFFRHVIYLNLAAARAAPIAPA